MDGGGRFWWERLGRVVIVALDGTEGLLSLQGDDTLSPVVKEPARDVFRRVEGVDHETIRTRATLKLVALHWRFCLCWY